MSNPLAQLFELQNRLEWQLDTDEQRAATGALEELSDDARYYGSDSWTTDATAPRQVKNLVLKAAARFMRNPDSYTLSRAGDETVGWTDRKEESGSAHFIEREIKQLQSMGGHSSLVSVPITAWGPMAADPRVEGRVPTYGGSTFPYYPTDDGPW